MTPRAKGENRGGRCEAFAAHLRAQMPCLLGRARTPPKTDYVTEVARAKTAGN
jgi:hypothetical protein